MSQKTDSPDFASGFIWQIVLLTVVVLCFAVYVRSQEHSMSRLGVSSPTTIFPWMIGGKQTIGNGLRAFGGKPPEPPPIDDKVRALGPVLVSMVLCPTVFFLEWRRRRLMKERPFQKTPLRISGIFYALCGLVVVLVAVAVGPIAYFGESARANTRHAHAIQSNRDVIDNELYFLAVDAAQYNILPRQLGGGERSFEGFAVPETKAKTEEASYSVTVTKSMVSFRATSTRYPSSTVQVNVDSLGHIRDWRYEGEFQ
ncbi:MAG: hypothetical protein NTZ35_09140 [Ignavibacteriales bacterium]|nr:hypothetical protein [Ignavibacteriales bacterium]